MKASGSFPSIFLCLLLVSCVNPINRQQAYNYDVGCREAEVKGQLMLAEELCYRAVKNAEWGFLPAEAKSYTLYNLARIKRKLRRLEEAEVLLKRSLEIEERRNPPDSLEIGRRLFELAICDLAQNRIEQGAVLLERIVPFAQQYSGPERKSLAVVFLYYSEREKELGDDKRASIFLDLSKTLDPDARLESGVNPPK